VVGVGEVSGVGPAALFYVPPLVALSLSGGVRHELLPVEEDAVVQWTPGFSRASRWSPVLLACALGSLLCFSSRSRPGCFTSLLLAINRHVVHCRPSSVPVAGGTLDIVTSIHRGLVGLLRSTETASCRAMQDSGSPALYFAHFTSVALRFGGPA